MGAAITSGAGSGQSRFLSLIEAAANVVVGYVLAIVTQIVVFPWFGIETGLTEHLTIGMAFVLVSLARGYLLRRLFERIAWQVALVDIEGHEQRQPRRG